MVPYEGALLNPGKYAAYGNTRAVETHFFKPRFFRFFKKPKNLKS